MVAIMESGEADFVLGSRQLGQTENTDAFRNLGRQVLRQGHQRADPHPLTDTSSGLRLMRADLTGTVTQTQPQYQTSELLIGALLQGYRVAEVPTVMRQRMSGESRKGRNLAYGLRYARVITRDLPARAARCQPTALKPGPGEPPAESARASARAAAGVSVARVATDHQQRADARAVLRILSQPAERPLRARAVIASPPGPARLPAPSTR